MAELIPDAESLAPVKNYERATHIPVLIYTETEIPALFYPQDQSPLHSDLYLNVIKKCREQKTLIYWAGPDGLIACTPIINTARNILGYLLIDRSMTNRSNDGIKAASTLLIWLAENVCGLLLSSMKAQQYVDNFYHIIYNALDKTPGLTAETLLQLYVNGAGKTTVYQMFHNYVHMSVSKYINFVRLEKAKDLLKETDLTVREVSDKVGFNDYNYFCRVFKKEVGMPATIFRSTYKLQL